MKPDRSILPDLVLPRLAIGLLLAVALAAPGCSEGRVSQAEPPPVAARPLQAATLVASLENWPQTVRVQGSLRADERVSVGTKVAGRVDQTPVDIGTTVRCGDVLVRLDPVDFELRVTQAKAQLEQARAALGLKPDEDETKLDHSKVPSVLQEAALRAEAASKLERADMLFREHAISEEERRQRQAAMEVAEARCRSALNSVEEQIALVGVRRAELALARQNLEDSSIRAPFDGVVQQRHVAPGSYVPVGQPVAVLVRTDPLRLVTGVPERDSLKIRVGQEIRVSIEGDQKPILAKVTRISPSLELSNRSLTVEVDLPNADGRLRAGLFAEAQIVVDPQARILAVPLAAVSEFAGVEKVWVVSPKGMTPQIVQTGRRDEKRIEILSGLAAGATIAADAERCQKNVP